jgi:hypothetical protein
MGTIGGMLGWSDSHFRWAHVRRLLERLAGHDLVSPGQRDEFAQLGFLIDRVLTGVEALRTAEAKRYGQPFSPEDLSVRQVSILLTSDAVLALTRALEMEDLLREPSA